MNKVLRIDFQIQPSNSFTSILWDSPPSPLLLKDVKHKLKQLKVIDSSCHLRFQEEIDNQNVWLDITNNEVPCPGASSLHIKVKVLKLCRVSSQTFLEDLFKGLNIKPLDYSKVVKSVRANLVANLNEEMFKEEEIYISGHNSNGATSNPKSQNSNHKGYKNFNENTINKSTSLNVNDHIEFVDEEDHEEEEVIENNNEDHHAFVDIDFNDPYHVTQLPKKKHSDEIDFLNSSGIPHHQQPAKQIPSNSLDELDELMSMDTPFKAKNSPNHVYQSKSSGGILDLDFGGDKASKKNVHPRSTSHQLQIDDRNNKLVYANEIDPVIKEWSKNSKTGTLKDIRSILISLKSLMKQFNVEFENISLSQIMSESAVKKMYFKVIRKIHPDKTKEKDPRVIYLFERVTEIVNEAFKKHKGFS